jgi:transcriptional regulator with XRE-family HTH domain
VPTQPKLGPALLKRRLGEELRQLRQAAGITVPHVAAELGSSEAKIRHLENGRNVPSKPDLTVMVGLYQAPATMREELEELRQAANSRGWWSSYRLPASLHNYVGLEADATSIRSFELELIPGLLQTAAYAREVHMLGPHLNDPDDVERKVSARIKRQELLTGEHPVELHAVISEAAFHRLRGSAIAAEQFRHLLDMARRPNVTISILPFSSGMHQSMSGNFVLLEFPVDVAQPVAYFDYAFGGHLEYDPYTVRQMIDRYDELAHRALNPKDSVEFLASWL